MSDKIDLNKEEFTALLQLAGELGSKNREIECMREAMQEFVDRCDAGQVLSKYTYAKFKRILGPAHSGRACDEDKQE